MRSIVKSAGVFAAALGICVCLLLSVCTLIPQSSIRASCLEAEAYFSDRAGFPALFESSFSTYMDNYADAALIDVIYNADLSVYSMIAAPYYRIDGGDIRLDLHSSIVEELPPNNQYARYWHGMQVFIRPLLTFTSVTGCRIAIFTLLLALNAVLACLLLRLKAVRPLAIYLAALFAVQFWMCAFTLEYVSVFLVMAAGCIAVASVFLRLPSQEARERCMSAICIVSGTLACFLDFLTAETLTLTVPLLLFMMLCKEKGQTLTLRQVWGLLVRCGAAWLCAYAATFAVKWLLVLIVLGKDAFFGIFASAAVRIDRVLVDESTQTVSTVQGSGLPMMFARNIGCLLPFSAKLPVSGVLLGTAGTLCTLGVVFYLFRGKKTDGAFIFGLLLLGLIPYLRFLVLSSHAHDHFFFTYRAQMATIMALSAVMVYSLKPSEVLRPTKGRHRPGR